MKTFICGCVLNCEKYLDAIFENIDKIIPLFDEYKIVIAYDRSNDLTLRKLCEYKKSFDIEILINPNPITNIRTQNICIARNAILRYIRRFDGDNQFDTFIMMDMDDVCSTPIMPENLQKYLTRDDWDALSFNRSDYYDIWALSMPPYIYSCWHVPNGYAAVDKIKGFIKKTLDKCDDDDLVECLSAFNGFAIYRMEAFRNVVYEWNITKNPMPKSWIIESAKAMGQPILKRPNDDDCEHRYFHMQAIRENGAKIRISPLSLFRENQHFPFDPADI